MATSKDKTPRATEKVLRVTSRSPSFRRAGFQFGQDTVDLPIAKLSKAQIEALKTEPRLVVVEAEVEVTSESEPDPAA